jgi:hypothetical protein
MMKFTLFLLLVSCASPPQSNLKKVRSNNGQVFAYRDVSGEFEIAREVKVAKQQLAGRTRIFSMGNEGERLLEKTFTISNVGSVKTRTGRSVAVRPELSQHTVWLEGKQYFSQLKLNSKRKTLEVLMQSPEKKWNGKKEIKVPKGQIFCFYSQLPECLVASRLTEKANSTGTRVRFIIVWDSYPYHQEHFSGLKDSPFSMASLGRETANSYLVEFNGQSISIHFSKDGMFARLLWTSQGISILPPAEMQDSQEL